MNDWTADQWPALYIHPLQSQLSFQQCVRDQLAGVLLLSGWTEKVLGSRSGDLRPRSHCKNQRMNILDIEIDQHSIYSKAVRLHFGRPSLVDCCCASIYTTTTIWRGSNGNFILFGHYYQTNHTFHIRFSLNQKNLQPTYNQMSSRPLFFG